MHHEPKHDMEIRVFQSQDKMAEYLFALIDDKTKALANNTFLNIALSGGSTPKRIFETISTRYQKNTDWDQIRFFQVDERCVPPDSQDSNYKMIRQSLFDALNQPDDHFFRIRGENVPKEEAIRYSGVLAVNLPLDGKWPVFDMVLLGLGEDGHTASLFPGDDTILNSRNYCEVAVHPHSGQKRITLTLSVINNAQNIVFLVTGEQKAGIVSRVILTDNEREYPASLVRPEHGKLIWCLDNDAAKLINGTSHQIDHMDV
jgi:6-phosphogluconolactonase